MSTAIILLTVLLVFVCVLMVLIILMQRPKQEGLGAAFGGGMTDQMFGAQTTNVLQKGTVYFAIFYFIASAAIAVLVSNKQEQSEASKKLLESAETPAVEEVLPEEASPSEIVEDAPAAEVMPVDESDSVEIEAPAETPDPEVIEVPAVEELSVPEVLETPEVVEPVKSE